MIRIHYSQYDQNRNYQEQYFSQHHYYIYSMIIGQFARRTRTVFVSVGEHSS